MARDKVFVITPRNFIPPWPPIATDFMFQKTEFPVGDYDIFCYS
jgi:hypothetical protein